MTADGTDGAMRWEHVDVTYTETVTRTVRVYVHASQPLTPEQLDANADHLVQLAASMQRHHGDTYRPRASQRFISARSVGHEVAGQSGTDTPG